MKKIYSNLNTEHAMKDIIKRFIDLTITVLALIFLLPPLAFLCILNLFTLGLPIFFCQKRIGLHEKEFQLIKLRTMLNAKDASGKLLPDAERLTCYGKFLRNYSLDEIPTLLNVLKGDLSLVGPRPLLPEYLSFYTPEQKKRHLVKPGITGLAQINGRNSISWEEKFQMDVWYVNNHTLFLDCIIICKTFLKVVCSNDISHGNHATMPRFDEIKK